MNHTEKAGWIVVATTLALLVIALWLVAWRFNKNTRDLTQRVCAKNLETIRAAKDRWQTDNDAPVGAVITTNQLLRYFPDGVMPRCPARGVYAIAPVGGPPECTRHRLSL